jgi:hypothetical protein
MPADTLYHGGKAVASRDGSTATIGDLRTGKLTAEVLTDALDELIREVTR